MTLQVKLYDAVVAREGSSRLNRPLVKFVKHGGLCLAISLDRLILLRCGDVSSNPGPHQKTLSCLMQNVRSLKAFQLVDESSYESKLGILRDIAYGYDLDVICLTETWLNEAINDHEILPTAYNIYRRDRVGRSATCTSTLQRWHQPRVEGTTSCLISWKGLFTKHNYIPLHTL